MSRSRFLGVLALPFLAASALAQDVSSDFQSAIDLWSQGRKQESLDAMRMLLASDPGVDEVYAAYVALDGDDIRALTAFMSEGDEYTLVAKRFLDRARTGRTELERDEEAILDSVRSYMNAETAAQRLSAMERIRNTHGEFAATKFINHLANEGDSDKVTMATLGLRGLGSDAVHPLVAALDSSNAFLRRNAALALGNIGDPRAGAHLLGVANSDESATVRGAAADAATRCGANGDAVAALVDLGNAYHENHGSVTFDGSKSDVWWTWSGDAVTASPIPRSIFNNEAAKDAYYRALQIDSNSTEALAGIARESVDIQSKLATLSDAGQDVSDAMERAQAGTLAVLTAGVDALDQALQMSVAGGDTATAAGIAQQLGTLAAAPTQGLSMALSSGGGAVEGEAAVALAHIANRSHQAAADGVVDALAKAAARRVVKVAVVIDANTQRADGIVTALQGENVLAQNAGLGTTGLVMLGQLPGIDAILVSDDVGDLTTDAVLQMIRQNPAFESTPVYLVTSNSDLADAYGDRVAGSFAGADGISALDEVFEAELDQNRARADALAARAAEALAALAMAGFTDVSGAADSLAGAIDGRRDGVAVPALHALGHVAGADAAGGILAIIQDDSASDAVRIAAADALGILGSRVAVSADAAETARAVLADEGTSLELRVAVARAVGRMNLGGEGRAGVVRDVRVRVGGSE